MPPVDRENTKYVSCWINKNNLDVKGMIAGIYERANKMYGTDYKQNQ